MVAELLRAPALLNAALILPLKPLDDETAGVAADVERETPVSRGLGCVVGLVKLRSGPTWQYGGEVTELAVL